MKGKIKMSKEETDRRRAKGYMRTHCNAFSNTTQLAEACCDELDLYENKEDYSIPEFIFELAIEFVPNE